MGFNEAATESTEISGECDEGTPVPLILEYCDTKSHVSYHSLYCGVHAALSLLC